MEGLTTYKSEKLAHQLRELKFLDGINCMLAGGSCLTMAQERENLLSQYNINDYDFFFEKQSDYDLALERFLKAVREQNAKKDKKDKKIKGIEDIFNDEMSYKSHETDFATTCYYNGVMFQFIKHFTPFEVTIDNFDLSNSKYFSFYPFNKIQTNESTDTLNYIHASSTMNFNLVKRILKYNLQKNLDISNVVDEMVEMVLNPHNSYYEGKYYSKDDVLTDEQKTEYLENVICSCLFSSDFREAVLRREREGTLFPYHKISKINLLTLTSLSNPSLPILDYTIKLFRPNYSVSSYSMEYIFNKFPEILL